MALQPKHSRAIAEMADLLYAGGCSIRKKTGDARVAVVMVRMLANGDGFA